MKFFQKKHSVCAECGVHFEPVTGYEARWGQFCAAHRKEHRENDEKKDAVLAWAAQNWMRLHGQMVSEYVAKKENLSDLQAAAYNRGMRASAQQMDSQIYQNSVYNPFRGIL